MTVTKITKGPEMIRLLPLLCFFACNQQGSPFFAQALEIGTVAVAYDGDRADGVVLAVDVTTMPGNTPFTSERIFVDGQWRSANSAVAGEQAGLDPGLPAAIPLVGFDLHPDGAVELAPASQRQAMLWCRSGDPATNCIDLADALRDPDRFRCFGKSYDGTYPEVECWQDGLNLDVRIDARPASKDTDERRIAVPGGAFFPSVNWGIVQELHLASSSFDELADGTRDERDGCRGDAAVAVALTRPGESVPTYQHTDRISGDVITDGYLRTGPDAVAAGTWDVTISTEKCLGGWAMDGVNRLDVWPLLHCGRAWVYASSIPDNASMCTLPNDPCACAASTGGMVCFRFGQRQLCSSPP